MLKICDESICKPLGIIYLSCLENVKFLSECKKPNVVPIFKKSNKQELRNYLSAHFYTACFRQNIEYYNMIRFFFENSLISQNQSGFKLSDSSTNQVLSFTHQIYKSFDNSHEILSVLVLNMLKAFYKVWHKHLIFKLKQNGISASLLSTITDFLKLRKQRVVLND